MHEGTSALVCLGLPHMLPSGLPLARPPRIRDPQSIKPQLRTLLTSQVQRGCKSEGIGVFGDRLEPKSEIFLLGIHSSNASS